MTVKQICTTLAIAAWCSLSFLLGVVQPVVPALGGRQRDDAVRHVDGVESRRTGGVIARRTRLAQGGQERINH